MRAIPYALSVHHFITSVGADAGFAAIIGLAIVVLLFFAHARETANLRDRATAAEDALHRLELYVDQLSRSASAPTAAPVPAPAVIAPAAAARAGVTAPPAAAAAQAGVAAPVASRTVVPAGAPAGVERIAPPAPYLPIPAAPAGVGAPALSAATRLIPAADDGAISIRATRPDAAPQPVAAGRTVAAVMDPPPPAPPPSTTAGASNGGGVPRVPPPASAGQTMGERPLLRPGAGRPAPAPGSRRRDSVGAGDSRISRAGIAVATVLVAVVVIAGLLFVTRSGTTAKRAVTKPAAHTGNAVAKHRGKAAKTKGVVTPSSVTVAVLNGTSTTNLAHDISAKLSAAGYRPGNLATASDQTETSTIVGYLPNYKRDALAVAKSLSLGPASVQAVDQSNRTLACNGSSTSCSAQVVVTVGSDLASSA